MRTSIDNLDSLSSRRGPAKTRIMRHRYDLSSTRYICDRPNCKTPIDIPSNTLYEFASTDDSHFWCPACEDLPSARLLGTPASQLAQQLQLPKQFVLQPVPRLDPSDDPDSGNLIYRPYSQRSFLRQYLDWLILNGVEPVCGFHPSATCFKKFDPEIQRYTDEINYELVDECNGSPCQFLRTETLKPLSDDKLTCPTLKRLCSVGEPYSFCETKDEAQILRNYLLLTGGDHYPMLLPQPSILSGRKRPDFLCFVPLTKFQYHSVAVLVDRPGKDQAQVDNENNEYGNHGYTVKRILVDRDDHGFSYFKAARELKNWIETREPPSYSLQPTL